MVQNIVYNILQQNMDKKVSAKSDMVYCRENENPYMKEYYLELYQIEKINQ